MIAEPPVKEIAPVPVNGTGKKWTYEEMRAIPDDVLRELHDGELIELPSPHLRHQKFYRALLRFIENWIDSGGSGLLYYQPVDLRISGYRSLIPDLSYFQTEDASAVEHESGNYLQTAPDLVVEVVSPSSERHDRVYKFRVYAEIGVRYYWIADPLARVFQAFKLENGAYVFEANLADEDNFSPELFPGLTIPMGEMFGPPEPQESETE